MIGNRKRSDDGAATVFGLALVALLVTVGLAGAVVAGAVLAHRRAQSAADLAALAAAQAAQGAGDPCAAAARVARRNHAVLGSCTMDGWAALVRVHVDGPRIVGVSMSLPARARAGPSGS